MQCDDLHAALGADVGKAQGKTTMFTMDQTG
jgi:hypothetical protein